MKRYLAIYKQLKDINLAVFFAYRMNAVNEFVGTSVWTILVIATMLIAVSKVQIVAGWSQAEILLLTGAMLIVLGLFELHFKRSFQQMPDHIYYGNLDALLLKPVDSQFIVSFLHLKLLAYWRILVGIFFVCYVVTTFHLTIHLVNVFWFSLSILFGVVVYYCIWLMAATLLIWYPRLSNILDVVNSLNHTSRFPAEMYREFNTFIFLFLLPYMFIIASPVKLLLAKATWIDVIGLIGFAFGLFILSRYFWKFALRYYTSVNS